MLEIISVHLLSSKRFNTDRIGAPTPSRTRIRPRRGVGGRSRKWQARFSACRFPARPNTRPSGETTGRWDVHRYGYFACLQTVVASRSASPPMSPAARRRSSRAIDSCYPSPRRRASSSSKSRRHGSLSQVANDVHHAHPASNQEGVERVLGRVPRHLPAHEVAVPGALLVRALAKRGVGDVSRMNIGQLADLRCNPGAPSHCSGAGWPVRHMK
jgi:hypothetical protein